MPSNPQPNPRPPGLPSSLSDPSVAELPPRIIAGRMLQASPCSLLTSLRHCELLSSRHRHTLSSRHCKEPPSRHCEPLSSRHCKIIHYVIARSPLHVIARSEATWQSPVKDQPSQDSYYILHKAIYGNYTLK